MSSSSLAVVVPAPIRDELSRLLPVELSFSGVSFEALEEMLGKVKELVDRVEPEVADKVRVQAAMIVECWVDKTEDFVERFLEVMKSTAKFNEYRNRNDTLWKRLEETAEHSAKNKRYAVQHWGVVEKAWGPDVRKRLQSVALGQHYAADCARLARKVKQWEEASLVINKVIYERVSNPAQGRKTVPTLAATDIKTAVKMVGKSQPIEPEALKEFGFSEDNPGILEWPKWHSNGQ